jgi:aminoglycoside phosphotransferase family enzyme/predicted kinase
VEVRQTHASWVFLTEDDAWKVKRPVDYGFLDYSDPEKRRVCCEEEVRLGRRLAPEVYRGVWPIHAQPEGLALAGAGPVVDHAVRMRRLPEEECATMLLARDRLTPRHLVCLAERLAAFYAASEATPALGAPAVLQANITENHVQTAPFIGRFADGELVDRLYQWQQRVAREQEGCLVDRIARGRIRDGHGDLRLEHVYYAAGAAEAPVVIDPIEFNRRFRCADQALDVAFLAMELAAARRPELASWFLASFARAANDYDFYPLADLYLSYRAWVRAKVACLVAADPATAPAKASRKAQEADRLFALAASYMHPTPGPRPLVVVGGMIGAGKSTLADALALPLQLPVVSSDATRKHLGGLAPTERGQPWLYSGELDRRTYSELLRRAEAVLGSGRGVILDGSFGAPEDRRAARMLARLQGRPFLLVELVCDDEILRARLRSRAASPGVSDAGPELLEAFRRRYRPATELGPAHRLTLDGRLPVEELVRRVRATLERP